MLGNSYSPALSRILSIIKLTDVEYTFRMAYAGAARPGQFFEVSIPKFGEAPISVSGVGDGFVDLTIRKVGRVTGEIFETYEGGKLFIRGPYGNGFDFGLYRGKELFVIAGGTGVSPVRGLIDHFARNTGEVAGMTVVAGFKTPRDILFRDDFERWRRSINAILTVDSAEGMAGYDEGLVTKYIPGLEINDKETAQAVVVGPPAMMRFSVMGVLERGFREDNIWVSYERRMCCGLGKCGHCRISHSYVCLDGPVYNYGFAKNLID